MPRHGTTDPRQTLKGTSGEAETSPVYGAPPCTIPRSQYHTEDEHDDSSDQGLGHCQCGGPTITNGTAVEQLVLLANASPADCVASELSSVSVVFMKYIQAGRRHQLVLVSISVGNQGRKRSGHIR